MTVFNWKENIVIEGENAQYQYFLLSSRYFHKHCQSREPFVNSLPNDKILDWSKFKAFADDKVSYNIKGLKVLKVALMERP